MIQRQLSIRVRRSCFCLLVLISSTPSLATAKFRCQRSTPSGANTVVPAHLGSVPWCGGSEGHSVPERRCRQKYNSQLFRTWSTVKQCGVSTSRLVLRVSDLGRCRGRAVTCCRLRRVVSSQVAAVRGGSAPIVERSLTPIRTCVRRVSVRFVRAARNCSVAGGAYPRARQTISVRPFVNGFSCSFMVTVTCFKVSSVFRQRACSDYFRSDPGSRPRPPVSARGGLPSSLRSAAARSDRPMMSILR
jgi:hypothetical protein